MSNILAIDLGTKCGWAGHVDGLVSSGQQDYSGSRFEGAGMRYLKFQRWLNEMHRMGRFSAIYFEEVHRHAGAAAAHAYGGFMSHLMAWGEENKVPYTGIPVGTIKKFWTGKGNASKDQMVSSARDRGYEPCSDNEADALAILHYSLEMMGNGAAQV